MRGSPCAGGPQVVSLGVADDGTGNHRKLQHQLFISRPDGDHLGLTGIAERVRALGRGELVRAPARRRSEAPQSRCLWEGRLGSPEPAEAPARVMLVDDHAIVRRGLRSILELEPDISVVAEAGGRVEALRALERARPDVILLDLKLSADHDTEGLELCSEIVRRRPQSNVVILSTFLNQSLLNQSLRRGAKAYVLKEVDLVELVRIIRRVARGESGFDGRSAEMLRALVAGGSDGRRPGVHSARARGHGARSPTA